jgi:hypothetical protein
MSDVLRLLTERLTKAADENKQPTGDDLVSESIL